MQGADRLLTSAIPLPRFGAFEAGRHRNIALQVLAQDFGLCRQFVTVASAPSVAVLPARCSAEAYPSLLRAMPGLPQENARERYRPDRY